MYPVNHIQQIGRLIERIDNFANLPHFGGDQLAGLGAHQGHRSHDRDCSGSGVSYPNLASATNVAPFVKQDRSQSAAKTSRGIVLELW